MRSLRTAGLIGSSPAIVQGRGIVTGAPLYAADVRLPRMLYGRVLRAPASVEGQTRPLRWKLDAARAVPGFVALREIASWGRPPSPVDGLRLGRGIACGTYKDTSHLATVADVAVDARGRVRVTRLWCVHDCGIVLNPDQVRAQCEGNLVWSLGMVLTDNLPTAVGHVTAQSFGDAPIPRMTDVPAITVDLIQSDRPPQGAGETAMVAGPGAIANAIRAATGQRTTRFPVRAEDLRA